MPSRHHVSAAAVVTLALTVAAGAAAAQQGVGAKYGARDPHTCPNVQAPTSGPPSAAQAAMYLACHVEGEMSRQLYLITDVHVQVGKGTRFLDLPAMERPFNGDPDGLVYAIRGSYKKYQCIAPSSYTPAGQNCNVYDNPRASGVCFRDKFADWVCNMGDLTNSTQIIKQAPPKN